MLQSGKATLTMNGVPVVAEATADGRLASARSSSVFALKASGVADLEVEQDAATIGTWRRVAAAARLPEGLAGRYRSDEMATDWIVAEHGGTTTIVASGPVATGPAWDFEPIDGEVFRVVTPGTLYRGWFDVRAIREQGRVCALIASGGRVKQVRYDRVT